MAVAGLGNNYDTAETTPLLLITIEAAVLLGSMKIEVWKPCTFFPKQTSGWRPRGLGSLEMLSAVRVYVRINYLKIASVYSRLALLDRQTLQDVFQNNRKNCKTPNEVVGEL